MNPARWDRNKRHWEQTLDARNLAEGGWQADIERQVALFETADIRWALDALEPLDERLVLDAGGGLALGAILLARRGARVVIADISLPRLKVASETLTRLGLRDRVQLVATRLEELPFTQGAFGGISTKSVLIHTRLEEACAELSRILAPQGRLGLVEPTTGNPFANLYRRFLGPKVWGEITTYFGDRERATAVRAFAAHGRLHFEPFFLLGFLATPLAFVLSMPRAYRGAERVLGWADAVLFALVRGTRKGAWMQAIVLDRTGCGDG